MKRPVYIYIYIYTRARAHTHTHTHKRSQKLANFYNGSHKRKHKGMTVIKGTDTVGTNCQFGSSITASLEGGSTRTGNLAYNNSIRSLSYFTTDSPIQRPYPDLRY